MCFCLSSHFELLSGLIEAVLSFPVHALSACTHGDMGFPMLAHRFLAGCNWHCLCIPSLYYWWQMALHNMKEWSEYLAWVGILNSRSSAVTNKLNTAGGREKETFREVVNDLSWMVQKYNTLTPLSSIIAKTRSLGWQVSGFIPSTIMWYGRSERSYLHAY